MIHIYGVANEKKLFNNRIVYDFSDKGSLLFGDSFLGI